jgi:hypothetical protein
MFLEYLGSVVPYCSPVEKVEQVLGSGNGLTLPH